MTTSNNQQIELLEANKIIIKGKEYSVLQGKNGGCSIFIKLKKYGWHQIGSIRSEESPSKHVLSALQAWHKSKSNNISPIKGVYNPILEKQNKEISK